MLSQLRTLAPYLARYRWRLAAGIGALVMKDASAAVGPLIIRRMIDALTAGLSIRLVWNAGLLLLAVAAVKGFFQYWMRWILIGVSRDIEYDLRNDLFARLTLLTPKFYGTHRTGDIMSRATNDLTAVRMMLGPGIMYWADTFFIFLAAVAVMGSMDWRLTFFVLLPVPAVSFTVGYFGRVIHDRFQRIQAMFSDISSRVQENLAGVRIVRAYAQEEAERRQFRELNDSYIAENLKLARVWGSFYPLLEVLIGLTFVIVLWLGGRQVMRGTITLGSFVMFTSYMGMLVWPMIALGWVVNLMQRGTASLKRINQLLYERPEMDDLGVSEEGSALTPAAIRGEIEFCGVSVDYGSNGSGPQTALHSIDLRIPAGQTLAIVGPTGSGKTTLVSLVARLRDPSRGEVRLDGVDIRRIPLAQLRRAIGMVPQETFLFSDTVAENIAFGTETAAEPEIREAARIAGIAPDIEQFPKKYETPVGERGITLSGGQKQRTAIARALVREPRILILDDALSSVDTMTEERILNALGGVMRGRTTLLISHRVSTVRNADRIVVLAGGRLVEQGAHDELLARGGYYAGLHQKQLLEEELEEA
ncbi:MAG TPA: ABC transporter ATP-binding protein [Bryobacterales bacterium]|nr:ABC transporter ATP-binding protein [Bryobacterales bacterium]